MKISLGTKTLLYPAPVMVIGTYGEDGRPNAMTAAWGGIACSNPPCVSISLRSATATHGNIMRGKAFTISLPSTAHVAEADYLGLVSGRDHDKFEELGLTPAPGATVEAPYVDEFPLVLECSVVRVQELGLHTQFVGEVRDVKADESILDANGRVDIEALRPILYAVDTSTYYEVGSALGKAFSVGRGLGG